MTRKNILYLRTEVFCAGEKLVAGGSVAHTLGVIEGLLAHNYDLFVASSVMHEQLSTLPLKKLVNLKLPRFVLLLRWKLASFFSTFFFAVTCLRLLREVGDVHYIYQRYALLNATGLIVSKIKKIPFILEYNGSEAWINSFWSHKKKFITLQWLIQWVENLNIRYADRIIVVSQPLKDELMRRGISAEKIIVNPNGVNTAAFNPQKLVHERDAVRHRLGVADSFVFGFIGTFGQWHGIELLTEMIPAVVAQKPKAHFLLIGDGYLLPLLKKRLQHLIQEKKVTCAGLIAQHEAKNYLAACDAFLSPTQPNPDGTPFFGSPTKIFEYLSMGKPIIASELNQIAEIIYPAITFNGISENLQITDHVGIVLPPTNVEAFVETACHLVDLDANALQRMGNNAREKAIKTYDWYNHVEKIFQSTMK